MDGRAGRCIPLGEGAPVQTVSDERGRTSRAQAPLDPWLLHPALLRQAPAVRRDANVRSNPVSSETRPAENAADTNPRKAGNPTTEAREPNPGGIKSSQAKTAPGEVDASINSTHARNAVSARPSRGRTTYGSSTRTREDALPGAAAQLATAAVSNPSGRPTAYYTNPSVSAEAPAQNASKRTHDIRADERRDRCGTGPTTEVARPRKRRV